MYTILTRRILLASLILLFTALVLVSNLSLDTSRLLIYHHQPSDKASPLHFNSSSTSTVILPLGHYHHARKSPHLRLLPCAKQPLLDYETARCKGEKLYSMIKAAYSKQSANPVNLPSLDDAWGREDDVGGLDETWDDFFKQQSSGRVSKESEILRIELNQDRPYKNSKGERIDVGYVGV